MPMTATDTALATRRWSRREFLLAGAGALLLPASGLAVPSHARLLSPVTQAGKHFVAALDADAAEPQLAPLPVRGHGLLVDPRQRNEILVIARRPGTQAYKIDLTSGRVVHQWHAGDDRHFFGHACYSADGRILFFTENDIEAGRGLVSVRDADDFRLLAEYSTHGIGPHELLLMPDGVTLAVANGGIQTLPETGRVKLNRGRIASSLVYLDSRDGRLLGKYPLPGSQSSLRHLAVAPDGKLAAVLQFEGDRQQPGVPLMVFHHGEDALRFAAAPQTAWDRMRHYAASVAYDPASARFAMTCPLGGVIACWDANEEFAGLIPLPKVSGIAVDTRHAFASNELGEVYRIDLARLAATSHATLSSVQWDNHLYLAPAVS